MLISHFAGLDPARPLVDRYGSSEFRLTRDDATMVQVIHTNAGFLGEVPQVGHVDFCVNGGRLQPSCANEPRNIRNKYCSSPVLRNDPLAQLRCRVTIYTFFFFFFYSRIRLQLLNIMERVMYGLEELRTQRSSFFRKLDDFFFI